MNIWTSSAQLNACVENNNNEKKNKKRSNEINRTPKLMDTIQRCKEEKKKWPKFGIKEMKVRIKFNHCLMDCTKNCAKILLTTAQKPNGKNSQHRTNFLP